MKKSAPRMLPLLLLAALLAATPGLPAQAGAVTIGEFSLSLSLPDSLDVFTRAMRADDPVLSLYGMTAEQAKAQLAGEGLYLKAFDIAGAYALSLSLSPGAGEDLGLMEEAQLADLARASGGTSYEVFQSRQATFLMFPDGAGRQLTCLARAGGLSFRLRLSASGSLTPGMAGTLRAIAKSADFGLGQ